jgi:hypothetical protein
MKVCSCRLAVLLAAVSFCFWQEQASGQRDEYHADEHDCTANRRKIEQREWFVAVLRHHLADKQVWRRTDHGHQAA